MKKLVLGLSIIATVISLIACSKDRGNGDNGYNNGYGTCANGGYQGFNYNQPGYQQGAFSGNQYYGNVPSNINCIPANSMYGGNPYYFQANYQIYLGTCDLRFLGQAQLCPNGYQCTPRLAFSSIGVCMRGY
jgi:hypothetical protein